MNFVRRNREAAIALGGAVAFFSTLAIVRHDAERLRAYLQVVLVLVILTALADRAARFSRPMVAALTSVAIVHLVGGLMTAVGDASTFYETWLVHRVLKFDQVAHFYGVAVLTFACWHLVVGLVQPMRRGAGLAFVAALMACGLGALNELFEFWFGLGNRNLHAGGLANTGWDLAFNLGGAIAGFAWLLLRKGDERRNDHAARRADARVRGLHA